jgi:flavin reductase (DIM6/NTAB) family NADH-FMN oxidoreductase RutF
MPVIELSVTLDGSVCEAGFRDALAHFGSGVTVVTARTDCALVGLTATAFTSVSLAPPLVLVCVGRSTSAGEGVMASEVFGISILEQRQRWIAERFARKNVDRFQGVSWSSGPVVSAPLIDGAIVRLECRQHARYDAGDHVVLVGLVLGATIAEGAPLLHHGRRFGMFLPETSLCAEALRVEGGQK